MNTPTKPRKRLKASQFQSEAQFWSHVDNHPEDTSGLDATAMLAIAKEIRERSTPKRSSEPPNPRTSERSRNGNSTATKNGNGRELDGNSNRASSPEPPIGYKNPPKQHRFQKGNPGGPGGQAGPRSMRKYIRTVLFDDDGEHATLAAEVTKALFLQAMKGNTHAIRIIVENGNRRHRKR